MKITTILQTYRRPSYFLEQYNSIKNQTIKSDKIIVVENNGGCEFNYPDDVEVIKSSVNKKYHFRFAIGLLEDCDYLFFYDDDTIPNIRWTENCLNTIEKHDCICVTNSRNVLPDGRQTCPAGWGVPNNEEVKSWFGGHSWALRKETLKYMFFDDIQNYNNGEDVQISANAWLYGNIPTYCPPHPTNDFSLWGSIKGKEFGNDKVASYLNNPIHYSERIKLIQYYLNKGWSPLQ